MEQVEWRNLLESMELKLLYSKDTDCRREGGVRIPRGLNRSTYEGYREGDCNVPSGDDSHENPSCNLKCSSNEDAVE